MYECSRSPILRNSTPNVIFCPPGLNARSALLRMSSNCERIPRTSSSHGHLSCMERFMCFSFVERTLALLISPTKLRYTYRTIHVICQLLHNFIFRLMGLRNLARIIAFKARYIKPLVSTERGSGLCIKKHYTKQGGTRWFFQ